MAQRLRALFLFGLLLVLALSVPLRAEDWGATARGMFMMLPESIFDSTPEGLDEAAKQDLLMDGSSEFWELSEETPDTMVFTALPFDDHKVRFRIYRNTADGSIEAVIGTTPDPVCTVEFWRLDAIGRIEPVEPPPDPQLADFFAPGRKLSPSPGYSAIICLDENGLVATPLFWDRSGMLPANVDNEVRYEWNGKRFDKTVRPLKR